MISAVKTGAVHADLLDSLGEEIAAGRLAVEQVLTLESITATYDVSRSVAREAIRVLESMGLVAPRRRVGITVQPRERWNVFDPRLIRWRLSAGDRSAQLLSLSELRRGFEPVAAALAAERATPDHSRALAAAVAEMEITGRQGDLEAYLVADQHFHTTLLDASGNEMMRALASVTAEVLEGRTHHHLMPHTPNPEAIALHDAVARAVRQGDAATAERSMRSIIDEAAAALAVEQGG